MNFGFKITVKLAVVIIGIASTSHAHEGKRCADVIKSAAVEQKSQSSNSSIRIFRRGDKTKNPVTEVLIWDRLNIDLSGFNPGERVTVNITSEAWSSVSEATFIADKNGRVDLAKKPLTGTYDVADRDGLFWSMQPTGKAPNPNADPDAFKITVSVNEKVYATTEIFRRDKAAGVKKVDLDFAQTKIVGEFYVPEGKGPFPSLLVYGGGEGGLSGGSSIAKYLASRGYAALGIAYFDYAGDGSKVPNEAKGVPVEYFRRSLDWLKSRKEVKADKIGVMGGSMGGEVSLYLGATFSDIKAVVAYSPPHNISADVGLMLPPEQQRSILSRDGKDTPFAPVLDEKRGEVEVKDGYMKGKTAWDYIPAFEATYLKFPERVAESAIPVEKTNGPILLLTGSDDRAWPSARSVEIISNRLREAKHPFKNEAHIFKGAGHLGGFEGFPTTTQYADFGGYGIWYLGGTPYVNYKAYKNITTILDRFLKRSLGN